MYRIERPYAVSKGNIALVFIWFINFSNPLLYTPFSFVRLLIKLMGGCVHGVA